MQKSFWQARWQAGKIGFHLPEANPYLLRHFSRLNPDKDHTIFVPLCGKSVDLVWLSKRVKHVVGIEIVPEAVEDFFSENALKPQVDNTQACTRYTAANITLFAGDFFTLQPTMLPAIDLVFDRAALIALPEETRPAYVAHMQHLLPQHARTLLITLDYPQLERAGPPFAVSQQEVQNLYGLQHRIELLESVDLADKGEIISNLSFSRETVYLLEPR